MRTSLTLLIVGFISSGMTLFAEDRMVIKAEPMLLAYYTPERKVTLMAEPAAVRTRASKIESKMPPTNWHLAISQSFKLSSASFQKQLNAETVSDDLEKPMAGMRMGPRATAVNEAKFSFNNLMEGSIYNFRKANGMRLEIGPPVCVKSEAFSPIKYEEPFCVSFWLRFKI